MAAFGEEGSIWGQTNANTDTKELIDLAKRFKEPDYTDNYERIHIFGRHYMRMNYVNVITVPYLIPPISTVH